MPETLIRNEQSPRPDIPKSRELFRGDINRAVIDVQLATGVEITPEWWAINVGNDGGTEAILDRFDTAFARELADRAEREDSPSKIAQLAATATETIPEGAEGPIPPEEYLLRREQLFRSIGGSATELVEFPKILADPETSPVIKRAELIDTYDKFSESVALIDEATENNPSFLGEGDISRGYVFEVDGIEHVARVVKDKDHQAQSVDSYAAALIRGKGIQGLEQVVACSYQDGIVISERAPGTALVGLIQEDPEALAEITDKQIEGLLETLRYMQEKELVLDSGLGNILYDEEAGFTVIDYLWFPPEYRHIKGQNFQIKLEGLIRSIDRRSPDLASRIRTLSSEIKMLRA